MVKTRGNSLYTFTKGSELFSQTVTASMPSFMPDGQGQVKGLNSFPGLRLVLIGCANGYPLDFGLCRHGLQNSGSGDLAGDSSPHRYTPMVSPLLVIRGPNSRALFKFSIESTTYQIR